MAIKASVLGALLIGLVGALLSGEGQAACAPGVGTAREKMAFHDALFVGRVVKISRQRTEAGGEATEVAFEVFAAWKGVHEPRVVLVNDSIFPAHLEVGVRYFVFAGHRKGEPRLVVVGCGETRPSDRARKDIESLGDPEYLAPAPTAPANMPLDLSVRPVTALAHHASAAPARPATQRQRCTDDKTGNAL